MLIICGGFGAIAIVGYMSPVVELSTLDGRCRIGLPPRVSFPLLCFDVAVNFLLTGVFFWLLRPVLDFHGLLRMSTWFGDRLTSKVKQSVHKREIELETALEGASLKSAMNKNIRILLWKCLIGSTLVMLPTVANMTQFYIMNSRELGWVCLTICTLDGTSPHPKPPQSQVLTKSVSWGVIIVNWLTIGSAEAESNLTTLMSQRTLRNDQAGEASGGGSSKSNLRAPFDIGLTTHGDNEEHNQEMQVRARQTSATTAEVPVSYKTTSLKDEGGLLRKDGVRESWRLDMEASEVPKLREPERMWGEDSKGWSEGSKSWTTVNDRVVTGQRSEDDMVLVRYF